MPLPLEGMRVLDLTRLLPGPFGTMLLADMGADVIKVEEPRGGDYARFTPPFASSGMSMFHHIVNRNKRSIAVDLKQKDGRELVLELAGWAEVLVEQFRPGVMERLGLDYDTIREVNPSIIYCSITGYGQDGPYRDVAGHDLNYLGYAGILDATGHAGGPPVICGAQIADLAGGGMFSALSILMAYVHMKATGDGQHLDVAMTDGCISWLAANTGELFTSGVAPRRGEQVLWGATPCYNVYEAADGYMAVGALEGKFWKRTCELLGKPEYADMQFSFERYDEIFAWFRARFKEKTRAEWVEVFGDEDTCVSPVLNMSEMAEDPQVLHRQMVVEVDDDKLGRVNTLGIPFKFSLTPGEIRSSAPVLGEHTDDILAMLGCSLAEVERLRAGGAVS
jgi:crotonobetainyl-CoA:carnitine CoA-transferase CaiB-like acyl-CoA transferase